MRRKPAVFKGGQEGFHCDDVAERSGVEISVPIFSRKPVYYSMFIWQLGSREENRIEEAKYLMAWNNLKEIILWIGQWLSLNLDFLNSEQQWKISWANLVWLNKINLHFCTSMSFVFNLTSFVSIHREFYLYLCMCN